MSGRRAVNTGLNDAVSTLWWGVRHFALVAVGCVLAVAVALPLLLTRGGPAYHASALVVAQRLGTDLAALQGYAQATFEEGAVARSIAAGFGNVGPVDSIVPDRVSLDTEQDSIVLRVNGYDDSAQGAADLANAAAAAFVAELNGAGEGVGHFGAQSLASPPAEPVPGLGSTPIALVLGLAAGVVLGLAVVSLLLISRRPVMDAADATEISGVPVMGSITLPRQGRGRDLAPTDVGGLIPVCRRLLAMRPQVIVLTNAGGFEVQRRQVCLAIAATLGRVRAIRLLTEPPLAAAGPATVTVDSLQAGRGAEITLVDGPRPGGVVRPGVSSATVLLVRQGLPERALRLAVAEHLSGLASDRLLMLRKSRVVRSERQSPTSRPRPRAATTPLEAPARD